MVPLTVMHMTCCSDWWSLCQRFMADEEESPFDFLREGEEWCLTCLRLDNDSAPCSNRLCRHRPMYARFRFALSEGQPLLAVRQLWRPRI